MNLHDDDILELGLYVNDLPSMHPVQRQNSLNTGIINRMLAASVLKPLRPQNKDHRIRQYE